MELDLGPWAAGGHEWAEEQLSKIFTRQFVHVRTLDEMIAGVQFPWESVKHLYFLTLTESLHKLMDDAGKSWD